MKVVVFLFLSLNLQAQVLEEIVIASPLETFSEKSILWNYDVIPQEAYSYSEPEAQLNRQTSIIASTRGSPAISIRGSRQADRVLVLLDGMSLQTGDGSGIAPVIYPLELIGSTKVLKGPASQFYGDQAMAGAIQHKTKRVKSTTFRSRIASYEYADLFFAQPLANMQLGIYGQHITNDYEFGESPGNSPGKLSDNDSRLLRFHQIGQTELMGGTLKSLAILGIRNWQIPGSTQAYSQGRAFKLQWQDENWTLQSQSIQTNKRFDSSFGFSEFDSKVYQQQVFYNTDFNDFITSLSTIEFRNRDYLVVSTETNDSHENELELSQTFHSEWQSWSFQYGARYLDEFQKYVHSGYTQKSFKEFDIQVSYSQGFRAPALLSRFDFPALNTEAGENLKPESLEQYELSMNIGRQKTQSQIAVFHSNYKDLLTNIVLANNNFTTINQDQAEVQGFELSIRHREILWEFYLGYTNLNTDVLRSPQNEVRASVQHFWGAMAFELSYLHQANLQLQDTRHPDINIWDFSIASYKWLKWQWKLGVFNFTDQAYAYTSGFPEKQREFYLSMERRF